MYKGDDGHFLHGVIDLVDVHGSLVEQVVEDIVRSQGLFPSLLVAEDEVDPLVEVSRYVVTLQCLNGRGGDHVTVIYIGRNAVVM